MSTTYAPLNAAPIFPKASVMAPAGMLAVSVPSLGTLRVKRTVVLPGNTLAPVTVLPAMPLNCKSPGWTDAGSMGSLKVTSYVIGLGNVNTPPTGGTVATTCSSRASYRNVPVNAATGSPEALVKAPAAMLMVWSPCVVTGLASKVKTIVVLPGVYAKLDAGVPLTVKSLACKEAGSTGSEMFTVNVVG